MSPTDVESSQDSLVPHSCHRSFQPERHRTVIDQRHLHVGPEYARGYGPMGRPGTVQEIVKEALCLLRGRRPAEARSGAFLSLGGQGELRNQQQLALDVAQREIHLPLLVAEDPVGQDPLQEPVRGSHGIAALHTNKGKDAAPDGTDGLGIDGHRSTVYPLNERNHGTTIAMSFALCGICHDETVTFGAIFEWVGVIDDAAVASFERARWRGGLRWHRQHFGDGPGAAYW